MQRAALVVLSFCALQMVQSIQSTLKGQSHPWFKVSWLGAIGVRFIGVGRLTVIRVVMLEVRERDLGVKTRDPLVHHCWNTVSSSSGTLIMVTECPLFTAWALAAFCPTAVLVVTTCLTVHVPSSWCPGGVSVQESRFPEAPSLMVKGHTGTAG